MPELNNTANVSVGKGVEGGYMFTAPVGTTLPTNYTEPLSEEWQNVGFLTDEGVTRSRDADNETYKDLNGDDIYTATSSSTRTINLNFAEVNKVSLGEVYGSDNVIIDGDDVKIRHNNKDVPHRSIVFEFVLRDGRRWRRVIEDAQVTEWEDETVHSSDLLTMGVTYTINKGNTTQDFIVDYMQLAINETTSNTNVDGSDNGQDTVDLNSMTKAELITYAQENNIDGVTDSMTKDEIIAVIQAAQV